MYPNTTYFSPQDKLEILRERAREEGYREPPEDYDKWIESMERAVKRGGVAGLTAWANRYKLAPMHLASFVAYAVEAREDYWFEPTEF
jgi:hypothetical protein